jgi:hypothetical protein
MRFKKTMIDKIKYISVGFILGALFMYILPQFFVTEIYETTRNVKLSNNSVINKNTHLIKYKKMPEGFTTYILYINTDDNNNVKRLPNRLKMRNYVMPYWIKEVAK